MTNGQSPIRYKYDQNRLIEIRFTDIPSGDNPANVVYKYAPSGSGNNTGKLVYKRDESGKPILSMAIWGKLLRKQNHSRL
jgi:hypothetical protein